MTEHPLSGITAGPLLTVTVLALLTFAPAPTQPRTLLSQIGFDNRDVAAVESGRAAAKVLSWGRSSEMYVLGAVHVNGSPSAFLRDARDVSRFVSRPGYLGAGELTETAAAADLASLAFDADDVRDLARCRPRDCEVQLPSGAILRFREAVNWSAPDAADRANAFGRELLIDMLGAYRHGGNDALGAFDDKEHPAVIAKEFRTMVSRTAALPDVLPELRAYLLDYPDAALPGADSFFYWEKVSFGLKPTIRLNHGVVYHTAVNGRDIHVVAIKQLYASHYFHTALDVSVCVADDAQPAGFYLLTLKASQQEGLTGIKGSLLRKIVADRTRSSLESALMSIKKTLESKTG